MHRTAADILNESADTFRARNAVYKDNVTMVGDVMKGLFPNGVQLSTPEDYRRFHILELIIVKLTRYAVNWTKGGHQDSIRDASCYSAILESLDEQINDLAKPILTKKGNPQFPVCSNCHGSKKDPADDRMPCPACHVPMDRSEAISAADKNARRNAIPYAVCPCWKTGSYVWVEGCSFHPRESMT